MLFVLCDWKIVNKQECWIVFVSILTDLSKSFDLMRPDCIITKLEVYGFHKETLKLNCIVFGRRHSSVQSM